MILLAPPAQGTAFTYQGFLTDVGGPANGLYDLEFRVFDMASGGSQQGSTVTVDDQGITNGLFTVSLDFGSGPFPGTDRWLDIAVRPGASADAYTNVVPRTPIRSAPYAIKAANATTVAMGTISDPSFFGTTTSTPLQLQVNNTTGLRLEYPTVGTVPNLVGGHSGNSVGAGTEGAVVAGGGASGGENTIGGNSDYSAIGGGQDNNIASNSFYATIAGGLNNDVGAGASYAFAAGRRAKANHQGAFVWADSQNADFVSTTTNQFNVRADGGVRFTSGGGGANQTVSWTPGSASWTFSSDRSLKENFQPVDARAVVEKVCRLPITEWNYGVIPNATSVRWRRTSTPPSRSTTAPPRSTTLISTAWPSPPSRG